jgi:diketogulonate reductase-like aldo/keto reductase
LNNSSGKTDVPILLENETLLKIALAHNKTPAQVCIRWGIQRNLVMLPKSVTPSRINENFEASYFISKIYSYMLRFLLSIFNKIVGI